MTGHLIQGRFRLTRFLAAGGMGAVYEGTQLSIGRSVAVKLMHTHAGSEQSHARFLREAQSISTLSHPNIVSLIDYGEESGLTYLVMELVTGVSLGELLNGRPASPALVFELLYQVASGLAEAHARGVIHRDLKPDNLLCVQQASGAVLFKIVDFGIAHATDATTALTASGAILGTPQYMSPEQAQDHAIDARSDLFSLGVIAYELAVGAPPFQANETLQVMLKICSTPHAPLAQRLSAAWPPGLITLCEQLLAKDPAARPASAAALLAQLDVLRAAHPSLGPLRVEPGAGLESLFQERPTLALAPPAQPQAASRGAAALLFGLLLLILGAVALIVTLSRDDGAASEPVAQATPPAAARPPEPSRPEAATAPAEAEAQVSTAAGGLALTTRARALDVAAELREREAARAARGPRVTHTNKKNTGSSKAEPATEPAAQAAEPIAAPKPDPLKQHMKWLDRSGE